MQCLQVEIQVRKIYCISRAIPTLPFSLEDAARSEAEFEKAEQAGEKLVRVGQDTRLNHRCLDLRTAGNQAIIRIKGQVKHKFGDFLLSKDFVEIETTKLTAGSSEGGAAVFKLQYYGQPACLAQSPQLYKQMSINGGFGRVFEVGPVYRAENSNTHRHLSEFIGLDAEMEIMEHYLRSAILLEAGMEVELMGDLNTEAEKKLGRLVKEKYGTDFFILYRYPSAVRPFYTMPCCENPAYSNSFDAFIRGRHYAHK
ncbi:hypothetical protein PR202_gb23567 [Eleusine coracana subsp. coracana]|uniref:aspartate--tRNA ligase n=1 Tax=Eleusine coracana subsp. coracana TaxID=191504 RepID=A0AAV5FJ98_ELECO|nr:hypothetical protein PR202_gb23567 [Eleusine coracana subsp. coracana]